MKMNRLGKDKSTNYSMTFKNKQKEELKTVEEIIDEVEEKISDLPFENIIDTIDAQTIDYDENASIDENSLRNDAYEYLQKNGFIESAMEFTNENDSAEEAIDEDLNITQGDGSIKDDNKLEENQLSKEQTENRNEYDTLQEEKCYPNKVSVIDILSKLKEISNKLK